MPRPPPGGVRRRAGGAPPGRARAVRLGWSGDDSGRTRSSRNGDRRVRDLRGVPRAHPRRRQPRPGRSRCSSRSPSRRRSRCCSPARARGPCAPPCRRSSPRRRSTSATRWAAPRPRRPPRSRAPVRMPATCITAAALAALPVSAPVDHGHVWMPVAHLVAAAADPGGPRARRPRPRRDRRRGGRLRATPHHHRRPARGPARCAIPADAPRARLVGALLHAALGSRGPPVVPVAA